MLFFIIWNNYWYMLIQLKVFCIKVDYFVSLTLLYAFVYEFKTSRNKRVSI